MYWKASELRNENKCDETCEKNVKNYTTMKNWMRAHNHSTKQTKIIAKRKQKQRKKLKTHNEWSVERNGNNRNKNTNRTKK